MLSFISALLSDNFTHNFIYFWVDLLSEQTEIQPMLLECNFTPCMTRALEDDPELINDMLGAFFLDTPPERVIRI